MLSWNALKFGGDLERWVAGGGRRELGPRGEGAGPIAAPLPAVRGTLPAISEIPSIHHLAFVVGRFDGFIL